MLVGLVRLPGPQKSVVNLKMTPSSLCDRVWLANTQRSPSPRAVDLVAGMTHFLMEGFCVCACVGVCTCVCGSGCVGVCGRYTTV